MKRPERYPYNKNQWVEESVNYYMNTDELYFTSHILVNRFTGEIKVKELEDE